MVDSLSKRYADALFLIAKEENKTTDYKDAIILINNIFCDDEKTIKFLESYFINSKDKEQFIDLLLKEIPLSNLNNFIKLLVTKHRINLFGNITKLFVQRCNDELGILEGCIYSACLLNKEQIKSVEKAFENSKKIKVELKNIVDKKLIGGIKVVIRDTVYDGSIKNKLNNLKNSLEEGRTNLK